MTAIVIPPYYDSLIGKLIVHGQNRDQCLMRLHRALHELIVDGVETTQPLFFALLDGRSRSGTAATTSTGSSAG